MSAEKRTGFRVVNHSVPRRDGRVKVTGRATYVSDVKLPGMAHAKVLRSPYAHARILSIDKSRAEAHPGVYCVVTGYDLEGLNPYYGHAVKDHPLLAIDKVRYAGEPVAAVVAVDERTAFEALEFIEVRYEELKAVFTPQEAMAPDAPLLHERKFEAGALRGFEGDVAAGKGTNICQTHRIQWGDVEKAFREAAVVVEGEYYFPMTYAYAMEPYVAIADVNEQGVTIYSSAQHPFMVRHDLKSIFNLPVSQVRLVVPFVGGGYGSKSYTKIEPLVAACSWKAKRPVKLQLTVEEAMLTTRSDDAYTWMRTAVDAGGRIIARQAKILMNTGAYAENSPLVVEKSTNRCVGPYAIPNVLIENTSYYTNTVPASSYRGFGCAQVTLPGESQIDELAAKLGKDPYRFRLENAARPGEEFFPGLRPFDGTLQEDLETAAEAIGWSEPLPENHGRTIACSGSDAGAYPLTSTAIRVHADGSVTILTGSTELGQGSHTVLAQIAAEELGVPFEKVHVVSSDTAITPYDRSTGASRTTTLMGTAVLEASREAIRQMTVMAADVLKVRPEEIQAVCGGVRCGEVQLSWAEVISKYYGLPDGEVIGRAYIRKEGKFAKLPVFWETACTAVEVAVDEETGEIRVEKLATVGDVGLAINPALAEGQDLGAATMGMGIGLFEELVYEGPQLVNGSILDYRVPRFSDLPKRIEMRLVQNQDGAGPYGAKGGGEASLNSMAANIANAVDRAVGVRIRQAPLTPERVWRALEEKKRRAPKAQ
ncbi:MAG TPA: xanthine dehydrogenase family protein molybdopterin-binding subunit [candidate division Zixibacteria bacterium]|nr:xanthine dehydrogenase family protein molybdopterin-binding subunit [candidate division Zixibacteria bacterium]